MTGKHFHNCELPFPACFLHSLLEGNAGWKIICFLCHPVTLPFKQICWPLSVLFIKYFRFLSWLLCAATLTQSYSLQCCGTSWLRWKTYPHRAPTTGSISVILICRIHPCKLALLSAAVDWNAFNVMLCSHNTAEMLLMDLWQPCMT